MLVCHCKRINDQKIRQLVADGARTVGQVAHACGAGTCCGSCVPAIAEVVEASRPLPITTFNMGIVAAHGPDSSRSPTVSPLESEFLAAE